jgi:hypothetical protein
MLSLQARQMCIRRNGYVARTNAIAYLPLECVCSPALIGGSEDLRRRLTRIGFVGLSEASQSHRAVTAIAQGKRQKLKSRAAFEREIMLPLTD